MVWSDVVTVGGRAQIVTDALFAPDSAPWLRAASDGTVVAAAAQAGRGTCQVVDSLGHRWDSGDVAFGVNCVGIRATPSGWDVTWMRAPYGGTYARVFLDRTLTPTAPILVQTPSPFGSTSQGFLDLDDDGTPIMTDQHRTVVLGGHLIFLPTRRGDWTIGQSGTSFEGLVAWNHATQQLYTVWQGPTVTPSHLTIEADGSAVVVPGGTNILVPQSAFVPGPPVPAIVVPTFMPAHRPLAVGAFFDHDRPFLTSVEDGTGRFSQTSPLIRGVFVDVTAPDAPWEASKALATKLAVPVFQYRDGYRWVYYVNGALPLLHAYLTPGTTVAQSMQQLSADVARVKHEHPTWGLLVSLHRGPTAGGFARGEQETLDMARRAWDLAVTEGARYVYVFAWRRPNEGPVQDGILLHESFQEAYRRMRAAVPDPGDWPTGPLIVPPKSVFRPFRRLHMDQIVGLRFGGQFLSSEPGRTGVEFRDIPAPGAWEKLRLIERSDKHVRFEFLDSGLTFCVTDDGMFETRPAGTAGPWETFIAGEAPSGEKVAFRMADQDMPILEVVEVTA